jgi:hypothetical protein
MSATDLEEGMRDQSKFFEEILSLFSPTISMIGVMISKGRTDEIVECFGKRRRRELSYYILNPFFFGTGEGRFDLRLP